MSEHTERIGPDDIGTPDDVGARVRQLRQQRGWSLRRLASELQAVGYDVDYSGLSRMEAEPTPGRQRQRIDVEALKALCTVFAVAPDDLLMSAEAREYATAMALVETARVPVTEVAVAFTELADMWRALYWTFNQPGAGAEIKDIVEARVDYRIRKLTGKGGTLGFLGSGAGVLLAQMVDEARSVGYTAFLAQLATSHGPGDQELHAALTAKDRATGTARDPGIAAGPWGQREALHDKEN